MNRARLISNKESTTPHVILGTARAVFFHCIIDQSVVKMMVFVNMMEEYLTLPYSTRNTEIRKTPHPARTPSFTCPSPQRIPKKLHPLRVFFLPVSKPMNSEP